MTKKSLLPIGFLAFSLALFFPLRASATGTADALSILKANNASAIAMCVKQENTTHTSNLKTAKNAYQKSVAEAKRVYQAALKAADDTLKASNTTENNRYKTASQSCKVINSNSPKSQTTPTAATGTVSVVVQDGAGHAFGHPADFDIRTGNEGEIPLFGSLTGDITKTSQPVGKYLVVARSLKYDGVIYTTQVTLTSAKDSITTQGDTVSYRIDYLAPGKISLQLYTSQPGISAVLHGPNGWSSSSVSDLSVHTFEPISAGDYWLGIGMPTDASIYNDYIVTVTDQKNSFYKFSLSCGNRNRHLDPNGWINYRIEFINTAMNGPVNCQTLNAKTK